MRTNKMVIVNAEAKLTRPPLDGKNGLVVSADSRTGEVLIEVEGILLLVHSRDIEQEFPLEGPWQSVAEQILVKSYGEYRELYKIWGTDSQ